MPVVVRRQPTLASVCTAVNGKMVSEWTQNRAALKAKIKIKTYFPPHPGRNRPKTIDLLREMTIRTVPLRVPGAQEQN